MADAGVDYEALAAGLSQAVPYNVHLGLRTVEVGPNHGVVKLPDGEYLHNHVGSQHAGALFSAGEAASGAAFVGAFMALMGEITPLAESAEVSYLNIARGEITATGRFTQDVDALLSQLREEGRIRFPVEVEMTDADGTVVAEMTVGWYVRLKDSSNA